MARTLPVCALLLALPLAARADDAPAETVIRLHMRPQAAPTPILKYQLLPEVRELNPGNPVQGYLVCFMEQNHFFFDKTEVENREKWQTTPLKDLPVQDLRNYGGSALRQADYAARLDAPDWQILPKLRRDGFQTLIPDVQWMRILASGLKVRVRAEAAERRFDDALVTAKTMFALSRHMGEHPTLIADLVGVVVANQAVGPLDELIQQPGCPNLYWALTDLPTPLIDFRKGGQGDAVSAAAWLHLLDDKGPMSDAQIQQFLDAVRPMLPDAIKGDPAGWLAARAKDEGRVQAARKRLAESGLAEDKVKQFPAAQVILLDEKLEYEIQNDEAQTRLAVPYWEMDKLPPPPPAEEMRNDLFPWVSDVRKVRQKEVQLDQRLALLRCVEALRIHAAENDGKLPAALADVKVPLPVDPVTGKPFPYQLDGGTATLRGTAPAGREKEAAYNVRYEVTIEK